MDEAFNTNKNLSNEAKKHLTLTKNWSDEAINASSPCFIDSSLHCNNTGSVVPNLSDSESVWFQTSLILNLSDSVAKSETKQGNPSLLPPPQISKFCRNSLNKSLLHRLLAFILFYFKR